MFKPIFNLKADNYLNAFILNALCASLSALIAIRIQSYGKTRRDECKAGIHTRFCNFYKNRIFNNIAVICTTFISTLCIYLLMNITFGYGGGMIA